MRWIICVFIVCFTQLAFAQRGGTPNPMWIEVDGDPSVRARTIVVSPDVIGPIDGNIMSLDILSSRGADEGYLRLDTTNDPLTDTLEIKLTEGGLLLLVTGDYLLQTDGLSRIELAAGGGASRTLRLSADSITSDTGIIDFVDNDLTTKGQIYAYNFSAGALVPAAGFNGEGDIYATSSLKALAGLFSEAAKYGTGLEVSGNALVTTYTNIPFGDATLTAATQTITDTHANFDDTYLEQYFRVASSTPSFSGAVGEIIGVTSSTEIVVSFGTAGGDTIVDATGMSFVIYPHPIFFVGDNGDIHAGVGVNPDASFKVHAENSQNEHAVHYEVTSAVDGNSALEIEHDADTYSGTSVIRTRYNATGYISEDTAGTILDVIIDNNAPNSEGGEIHAIDVAVSDVEAITIDISAVSTHSGVDVIHQHLSDPPSVDAALSYDASTTTFYNTTIASSDTVDYGMFEGVSDVYYYGAEDRFDEINSILFREASHTITPLFEYSEANAASWVQFVPADDTSGYQNSGNIRFESDNLITWGGATEDQVSGAGDAITDLYWVRVTRTRNVLPTHPTDSTFGVLAHSSEFLWTKEGALSVDNVAVTDGIVEPGTVVGFAVIYVDKADGDLKVKFGDGFVATIVADS